MLSGGGGVLENAYVALHTFYPRFVSEIRLMELFGGF